LPYGAGSFAVFSALAIGYLFVSKVAGGIVIILLEFLNKMIAGMKA
jgi:hypothetical protein